MGNLLSATLTESEIERQKNAERMEMTLDPRGKGDLIMITIISVVYSFDFLAVLYMFWNRKYAPIKSKNITIMALIVAVSVVWFVGDLQTNGHIPVAGTHLVNCMAFGMWMRTIIGACGMLSLIAFRAHGLYRVFYLHKPYHGLGLYLPFIIYWVCALVVGLVSQLLKSSMTTEFIPNLDVCSFNQKFQIAIFTFLWVTVALMAAVHWRIRKIKSSFNESREMLVTCVIISAILLYVTVMNYVRPRYPLDVRLRIINTCMDHFATNALWWQIMWAPLFKCMFDRQRYLDQWTYKLQNDGFQREYEINSGSFGSNNFRSQTRASFSGKKEGGMFYAIDDKMYNGNNVNFSDNSHSGLSQTSTSPMVGNGGLVCGQSTRLSTSTERHHEDVLMEIMMEESNGNGTQSNTLQPKSQLYTPISFPDAANTAPLKLGEAHSRHLDYVDPNERQLV
ncbi:hypothetical protein LPJ66_003805 [Kickxella alabastrina]|uniref:Uncharacterized protein n=1 Tax=Kickxella alabastrina TaxID=61397 RepID=A0ACC1IJ29_9FUNG|nr:hypothetical protein LPJ66_003805 [Kickxella alabastrina]